MRLRSGTAINCCVNSPIVNEMTNDNYALVHGYARDINSLHYGYCEKCCKLFGLFDFLEKYHKEIRGEERNVHGKMPLWTTLYKVIRDKLEEFINVIDTSGIRCTCDRRFGGKMYDNICFMIERSKEKDYIMMANYTGYGREREKYRIYHKNFFDYRVTEDGVVEVTGRNLARVREELAHWLKYFKRAHQSVIDKAKKALVTHKRVTINADCITEVLSFL